MKYLKGERTVQLLAGALVLTGLLFCAPAHAQLRISAQADCNAGPANPIHFDQTIHQADYKVMVSDYEVDPDIRIRLVNLPGLADLVLTDQPGSSKFTFCRSATRYRSTTLFVAKFVTQPDVIITLNKNDRHADYTLYVESQNVSNIEAAALFWLALRQQR